MLVTTLCFTLSAQMERKNSEISFSKEPIAILEKEIVGWVKTNDGQWKSAENTILNKDHERKSEPERHDEVGQDNFVRMHVYDMLVDGQRLWIYVKFFKNGKYKYEQRRKGWKERLDAYYFIVNPLDMPDLHGLANNETYVFQIPTKGAGNLKNIKKKNIIERIERSLSIPLQSERLMLIHLRVNKQSNKAQFQIASIHKVFSGTQGIVKDLIIDDSSVYGKKALFEYLYFETTFLKILNILPMKHRPNKQNGD